MSDLLDRTIRDYPADEQPPGLLVAARVVRRQRADARRRRCAWTPRSVGVRAERKANKSTK